MHKNLDESVKVRVVTFSESGRGFFDFSTHYYLIKLQISFKSSPLQKVVLLYLTFFGLAVLADDDVMNSRLVCTVVSKLYCAR